VSLERNIYLIGMMGVGKSTVGRYLADRLGWPLLDLDSLIEAEAGMAVSALFATEGEAAFRDREEALLARIAAGWRPGATGMVGASPSAQPNPVIVATGGGAVLREGNRARMQATGLVVWLTADPSLLLARAMGEGLAKRPLLAGEDPAGRLRMLLEARAPLYVAAAHLSLPTDGLSPAAVGEQIIVALGRMGPGSSSSSSFSMEGGERDG
jgi:shikimate kinase